MQSKIDNARASALAQSLPKYRALKERAYSGTTSPRTAIKAFCLACSGDSVAGIRDCTSYACPLREYRPYVTDGDSVEGE